MRDKNYDHSMSNLQFRRLVSAVVKESGICRATVEQVLPAAVDVIRRELCEGERQCILIESFGTIAVKTLPARKYHYVRRERGIDKWVEKPQRRILKFAPTRNMRREVEQGRFDPTRRSFYHHPDEPLIRNRSSVQTKHPRGGRNIFKVGSMVRAKKQPTQPAENQPLGKTDENVTHV